MNESNKSTGVEILPDGFSRDLLPAKLVEAGCYSGAEIGVLKGEYSEKLMLAGLDHLFLVDLWRQQTDYKDNCNVPDKKHEENLNQTVKRMSKWVGKYTILRCSSVEAAEMMKDRFLDFIYLDANHSKKAVTEDLECWCLKVKRGGMICGHDFLDSPNFHGTVFGVKSAVIEFCSKMGIPKIHISDGDYPNWHFINPC